MREGVAPGPHWAYIPLCNIVTLRVVTVTVSQTVNVIRETTVKARVQCIHL